MNEVPKNVSEKILNEVKAKLHPDLKILLTKVLAINILSSLLTLLVCPQLGYSFIETKYNLMDVFMKVSPWFCDFACGAFFTSTSVASLYLFLSRDELRALKFKKLQTVVTILLSSMGLLLMLNPALFIGISALWLLGILIGCLISLQLGSAVLKNI